MNEISIRPEREYLHEILTKMRRGVYTVPLFQRRFVWERSQVLDLFDSISKGYPIGSILLWRPKKDSDYPLNKGRGIIDDKPIDVPKSEYFILDGRQRLTTFYGCLVDGQGNEAFDLYYDLRKREFGYRRKNGMQLHEMKVSDLYDTFSLLTHLQKLLTQYTGDEAIKLCNEAKRMNSIFQSYQIGELLFEDYSLDEASTVFSRINSKGTDIAKTSMLQAILYSESNTTLLSDRIDDIINRLSIYGFDGLKSDDVLNCCYPYCGKRFYDSGLMLVPEQLDFTSSLDEIETDIKATARFLNDECGVLSSALLPYLKQFNALAYFFKCHKSPTPQQKHELRRWLYYTSVNQLFLNSSLSIIRNIFNRFEEFVSGKKDTAYDYEPISAQALDFAYRFRVRSARSSWLLIAMVCDYRKRYPDAEPTFNGTYNILSSTSPIGVIPLLYDEARKDLSKLIKQGYNASGIDSGRFFLSPEMLDAIRRGDLSAFSERRKEMLLGIEKSLLESVSLQLEEAK